MDSRRLTIFPRAGNGVENASSVNASSVNASSVNVSSVNSSSIIGKGDSAAPSTPKRKFQNGNGPVHLTLPKLTPTLRVKRKFFTPLDEDPGKHYRCIHSVDPEGERPYCLAQEIASDASKHAYRVVMIRRSPEKSVVSLDNPNPNLLNIVSVFRFQGSLFTVFDRPGLPLSEVAVSHSPPLGLAEVRTISTEAISGICALSAAGIYLSSIDVEDVTISASDGQVKVALDRASLQETMADDKATAFRNMLEDLMSRVPDPSTLLQSDDLLAFIRYASQTTYPELQKDSFLKDSLPAPSLIPFVLNAQIIVLPVEHVTETRISELRMVGN